MAGSNFVKICSIVHSILNSDTYCFKGQFVFVVLTDGKIKATPAFLQAFNKIPAGERSAVEVEVEVDQFVLQSKLMWKIALYDSNVIITPQKVAVAKGGHLR